MKRFFPPQRNFNSLSIKDLLEARETYHVHLYNKKNVIATAIGKFRIRKDDPDVENSNKTRSRKDAPPRTLENTVVKSWSWPCILVFVKEWLTQDQLKDEPDQVVPPFVYMSDGRVIPICVIYAPKNEYAPPPLFNLTFPSQLMGGGYPVLAEVQGQQHVGSLGCLVTDGDSVYALTNKHVTGEKLDYENGRDIFTVINGKRCKIGSTYHKQLAKKLFQEVYKGWPGNNTYSNLDAGLIKIDDINYWTAQVFGIGELDELIDLNTYTISLDLIGCPVHAFGGASGKMTGEIQALFYRYKSLGGFDYISDLLIGPIDKNTPLTTKPGDSGTVWFYDPMMLPRNATNKITATPNHENKLKQSTETETSTMQKMEVQRGLRSARLQPIALQWGGHILMDESRQVELNFALATCLSTICRELDVDIVRSWNVGHSEYWGKLAHYKIAAKACSLLSNIKLSKLMQNNLNVIAFDDNAINEGEIERIDSNSFVPLADVPDLVWRNTRKNDEANHFADMDEEGQGPFVDKTLLDITKDQNKIDIKVWNEFYDNLGIDPSKRGALPFRVWQIYNEMVKFVSQSSVQKFVCAAGVLSHYVGDASQPLHVSKYHHGHPDVPEEKPVHSDYETKMIDRYAADIISKVNNTLNRSTTTPSITSGRAAAASVIDLMRRTVATLPPLNVVDAYNEVSGLDRIDHMFEVLGDRTVSCISEGCLTLATLWESAWKEGNGDHTISDDKLVSVERLSLKDLYEDKWFLEAFRLTDTGYVDALR